MSKKPNSMTLKQAMTKADRQALGNMPTTHQNCIAKTGVARPGKTARDRLNKAASKD